MSKHFVFTLNNPTQDERGYLATLFNGQGCIYALYGNETAPTTGTPHLQGYVCFTARKSISSVRTLLPRAHVERAVAPREAIEYCKKEGDFVEFGDPTAVTFQGKRTDLDDFIEWVTSVQQYPSDDVIIKTYPKLWLRYSRKLCDLRNALRTQPALITGEHNLRQWQQSLTNRLEQPADDRKIIFVIDEAGSAGKSWFVRKYLTDHDDGQFLSVGKRDDLAHAIDESKRIFFLDIPRGNMEYLQYGFLEQVKNRLVFSPKYNSVSKILQHQPHVVVFSNEDPDRNALTRDRYDIIRIVNLTT